MKERTGRTVTAGRIGGLLEDAAESVVEVGLPTLVTAGILTRFVPGPEGIVNCSWWNGFALSS